MASEVISHAIFLFSCLIEVLSVGGLLQSFSRLFSLRYFTAARSSCSSSGIFQVLQMLIKKVSGAFRSACPSFWRK